MFDAENISNEIVKIRRYLVINTNPNNDIKTIFQINSKYSSFNPCSEIINFTKSNSMSQIINLYLDKIENDNNENNLEDEIKFNWMNFIIDEKHISEQFEKEENKINENNNNYDNDWNNNNENGGFELECPNCKIKNIVSGNEPEFICKNCNSNLLQ